PVLRGADDEPAATDDAVGALRPPDDVALATQAAEAFFTDENALAYFPREAPEVLGAGNEWSQCLPGVRCAFVFGWLVCHGCRDFNALNYYLYRYLLCVRVAQGRDPRAPLSALEREDFRRLAAILGQSYAEWLKEEELKVELDAVVPDDVSVGRLDCCRHNTFTAALFDRLGTDAAAEALMGREAFAARTRNPFWWLCFCWARAALRLGCCVACARTREQLRRCLADYEHSLQDCLGPLRCQITSPHDCFEEQPILEIQDIGVPVIGSALGAFFGGYTVEYRFVEGEDCHGPSGWTSVGVVYPGHGAMGTSQVQNGTLAWIKTRLLPARSYEVRVCLTSTRKGESPPCCCIIFNLFKRFVWINRVGAAWVGGGGVYDPTAPLVYPPPGTPGSHLVPIGCCVNVHGAAWVGECNDRRIKCFSLLYAPGCLPGPTQPGFDPTVYKPLPGQAPVCYTPPDEPEKRAQGNELTSNDSILTVEWVKVVIDYSWLFNLPPHTVEHEEWQLRPRCWDTTQMPACLDSHHTCASGEYTLLLKVEDTHGHVYYDTTCVILDNKQLHVRLAGIRGWEQCQTLNLRPYAGAQPCTVPWPVPVMGTVYDEYIDPTAPLVYPNNNFDFYTLTITRNCGGPSYQVPITRDWVHFDADILTGAVNKLHGTAHVGIPAPVCACDPQLGDPFDGVLTTLDMRVFDAVCSGQVPPEFRPPAGFALRRGECCTFTFTLCAQDKTVDEYGPGHCHYGCASCCIQICNDLPQRTDQPFDPIDPTHVEARVLAAPTDAAG
ncbi:MAG TPA: hypothetical protein VJT67_03870, partial [Longimicrobiaceae bacterium]|nr:hypothetical protein [Longimicrobiaceae bacterium]